MKLLKYFLPLMILGAALLGRAQTISVSSGVSQPAAIDGKTVKIYAGWANAANNCGSRSNTELCDTCLGGNSVPCNRASIHGNLYLQIDVSSTTAGIDGLPVQLSTDATTPTNNFTNVTSSATASGYSIRIAWKDLCGGLPGITNADCGEDSAPTGISRSIYFGPIKDGKFLEMITVEVNLSVASGSTASNYTECPNGATTIEGAGCYFEMFGGDEKAYVNVFEPSWSVDSPSVTMGSASFPIRSIIFFAAAVNEATESTDYDAAITNTSDSFEIGVQSGEDPLTDNRLNDLENDTRYCFKMATQDITGNIQKYTPTGVYSKNKCATPSEVAGILSDKNCFIATAAFGSSLNRHVQKFREFRNQFLSGHEWGKKFIQVYYKYGSQAASFIKKHDTLRTVVRGALWPLLIFVEISLKWGILWGIFSVFLTALMLRRSWQTLKYRWIKRTHS